MNDRDIIDHYHDLKNHLRGEWKANLYWEPSGLVVNLYLEKCFRCIVQISMYLSLPTYPHLQYLVISLPTVVNISSLSWPCWRCFSSPRSLSPAFDGCCSLWWSPAIKNMIMIITMINWSCYGVHCDHKNDPGFTDLGWTSTHSREWSDLIWLRAPMLKGGGWSAGRRSTLPRCWLTPYMVMMEN